MSTATKEQEKQVELTTNEQVLSITNYVPLSERVRRYVLEKSGGLAEIARKTGLPKTTLNPWLLGQKGITTGVLDKICEAYEIVPFRIDGTNSEHVPTVQSAIDSFSSIMGIKSGMRLVSINARAEQVSQLIEANRERVEVIEQELHQIMEKFTKNVIEIEKAKGGDKT